MTTNVTVARPGLAMKAAPAKRPNIGCAVTDPRTLSAALSAWCRIAVPVPNPDPCTVSWCVNCWAGTVEDTGADTLHHHTGTAVVDAISYNGIVSDLPKEAARRVIEVNVERLDDLTNPDRSEPTDVYLNFGNLRGTPLPAGKARDLAAALRKAETSAASLLQRDARSLATGAISIVRLGAIHLQVGAIVNGEHGDPARTVSVFVNIVEVETAYEVRCRAHGMNTPGSYRPDSWDVTPAAAVRLADMLDAAAVLVDADRAATR